MYTYIYLHIFIIWTFQKYCVITVRELVVEVIIEETMCNDILNLNVVYLNSLCAHIVENITLIKVF